MSGLTHRRTASAEPGLVAPKTPSTPRPSFSDKPSTGWKDWCPFTLDLRALSILRIGLGLFTLMDIYWRLAMSIDWYTSRELAERSACADEDTPHHALFHRILFYRGSYNFQCVVFTIHIVLAILYTLGVRTNLVGVLLHIATISLHGRQEAFNDGSDKVLRNWSTLCMFLPMGAYYSYDARRRRQQDRDRKEGEPALPPTPLRICNIPSAHLVLQTGFLYAGVLYTRWHRDTAWWPRDGSAIYYITSASLAVTPFGRLISHYPWFCYGLTSIAIVMEAAFPILLLVAPANSRLRLIAAVGLIAVQSGISLILHLPNFHLIASVTALGYLPSYVFEDKDWWKIWQRQRNIGANQLEAVYKKQDEFAEAKSGASIQQKLPMIEGDEDSSLRPPVGEREEGEPDSGSEDDVPTPDHPAPPTPSPRKRYGKRSPVNTYHRSHWLTLLIALVIFLYSLAHFGAQDMKLFRLPDDGDIGQATRFFQGWLMFDMATRRGWWFAVTGTATASMPAVVGVTPSDNSAKSNTTHEVDVVVDVMRAVVDGNWQAHEGIEIPGQLTRPACMPCLYWGWRYERWFSKLHEKTEIDRKRKMELLTNHWCWLWEDYLRAHPPHDPNLFHQRTIRTRMMTYNTGAPRYLSSWLEAVEPERNSETAFADLSFECDILQNRVQPDPPKRKKKKRKDADSGL